MCQKAHPSSTGRSDNASDRAGRPGTCRCWRSFQPTWEIHLISVWVLISFPLPSLWFSTEQSWPEAFQPKEELVPTPAARNGEEFRFHRLYMSGYL